MAQNGIPEKKSRILKLLEQGETDLEVISEQVGCSKKWVKEVKKEYLEHQQLLPVTLQQDLALSNHLAEQLSALVSNEEERVGFAKGVKAMLAMQAYDTRLLGQLMTIPTQAQKGQLEEILTLAKAMEPKTDPTLVASLNSVSQSIARMAAPKTPQGMLMETMMPIIGRIMGGMFGAMPGMGVNVPQNQSEGSSLPPGWTRKEKEEEASG